MRLSCCLAKALSRICLAVLRRSCFSRFMSCSVSVQVILFFIHLIRKQNTSSQPKTSGDKRLDTDRKGCFQVIIIISDDICDAGHRTFVK